MSSFSSDFSPLPRSSLRSISSSKSMTFSPPSHLMFDDDFSPSPRCSIKSISSSKSTTPSPPSHLKDSDFSISLCGKLLLKNGWENLEDDPFEMIPGNE